MIWKTDNANSDVKTCKIHLAVSVQCLCAIFCDNYLQMTIGTFEVEVFKYVGKQQIFDLKSLSSKVR